MKIAIDWCRKWVSCTNSMLAPDSSLYVWLGADQNDGFQPLPDFMLMTRDQPFRPRSFITMRNQRGYGTQKNWMAVRQELLYYTKGNPRFNVEAEYTQGFAEYEVKSNRLEEANLQHMTGKSGRHRGVVRA